MLRAFEGRSLPISIVIHGAAVGAVICTSLWLPEPFPETLVRASSAPVSFPIEPRPQPTEVGIARRPLARSRSAIAPSVPSRTPAPASSTSAEVRVPPSIDDVSPGDVVDFDGGSTGGCHVGCVVSTADSVGPDMADGGAGPSVHRVGGDLHPPRKIRNVAPEYPELARRLHISGEVVVDCLIDEQGHVREASALRGNPLLAPAAVAAVERWAYEPSRLNGVPVQVLMTVTVRFQLK